MARKKLCLNCRYRPRFAKGLCKACHEYQRRTGRPRPLEVIVRHYQRSA